MRVFLHGFQKCRTSFTSLKPTPANKLHTQRLSYKKRLLIGGFLFWKKEMDDDLMISWNWQFCLRSDLAAQLGWIEHKQICKIFDRDNLKLSEAIPLGSKRLWANFPPSIKNGQKRNSSGGDISVLLN